MKRVNLVKCLFGYHRYKETWLIRRADTPQRGQYTYVQLKVCTTCRGAANWEIVAKEPFQVVTIIPINIEEETKDHFLITGVDIKYKEILKKGEYGKQVLYRTYLDEDTLKTE